VRGLIEAYGIDTKAIFGRAAHKGSADASVVKRSVVPKFRDLETGKTWTGRGMTPKWLVGKNRDDFRITAEAA
jgi:DNA-binding protein H-NS